MTTSKNRLNGFDREDRDLLVELRTEMTEVRKDIRELKDGTATRLAAVEMGKLEKDDFEDYKSAVKLITDDHELRMRKAETSVTRIMTWGSAALVVLGVAEFILQSWLRST